MLLAEPMDDDKMTALMAEMGELQDKIDAPGRLGAGPSARDRHGRAALPARRPVHRHAVRRREAPRRAVPPAAGEARPAAARRAHQPPRRRVGGLAREAPARVRGHRGHRHARPLLPRQRHRLDPRAGLRQGPPLGRQLLVLAGAEEAPSCRSRTSRTAPPQDPRARAGVGQRLAAGPPEEDQGAPLPLRGAGQAGARPAHQGRADPHPGRPAPGRPGGARRGDPQGATATSCSSRT